MVEACRTCLKLIRLESSPYFEIEDANVQLSPNSNRFKILSVLPEMALNISKRSLICTSCHQTLETIYQFKAKCLRTESMIMRYIHSKPDIEIEALDLKDVAFVNNTGFVCGSSGPPKASEEKSTSHENTKTNLLPSHSKNLLDKDKNISQLNGSLEKGGDSSLLHKKLLQRVLGNNNSVSLHFVRNVNADKGGGKDRVKPVEVVKVNGRNNSRCEAVNVSQVNNSGCENGNRRNNSRREIIRTKNNKSEPRINGTNNRNEGVENQAKNCISKSQQKDNGAHFIGRNGTNLENVPYYKNQPENVQRNENKQTSELCELSENVTIKQEIFPDDEDSTDGFDVGLDIDESITVVKHELVNDYDETEVIIPPENTILNVSVKSDDSKPAPAEEDSPKNEKPIKYDLRKRACNKPSEDVQSSQRNTYKRNIKSKIMKIVEVNKDTNKEVEDGNVKETPEAVNNEKIPESNVDSSFDTNASDDDDDDDDYIGDADYSEDENDEDYVVIKKKPKYSRRNHVKGKGVTTIRLKCIGSNLSIRRVIPKTDIKSYKVSEAQNKNLKLEVEKQKSEKEKVLAEDKNLKLESEISVMSLAEKEKTDNQLQLPHLSVIPICKKNKEIMCDEVKVDGLEIIPVDKSVEVNEDKLIVPPCTEEKPMEIEQSKAELAEIPMELDTITKSEDLIDAKFEDAEPILMEVDVILNESIKSNDSGIQNTSGSEQTDDALFKCQVCLKNFITKSRLKTHMLCHTDERPYKCTLCIKGFNDKSTLNKHLKIHSGIKEYECEICQRQFYCKGNLNKHMSTHSGERPYRCNVCNRDFSRNEHLKQHRLIHTGDKNFGCDICSKKFARRDSLIIHMMVHTGVRNYVCEYCDKRCIDSSTLKKHLRSHTGDKPYECETCHRRFTQKTHLTIHRRKHTGERPYNCTVCNKGFYSSNYLKIHKRTHTKEQPYQCDVCKKRFSTVSNLRMHKKIHTGIRDFECGICSKMFIHKHDLRKHMMVHTQEKPFSCHVCRKAFNKKVRAKQHIMNMHKEVDISTIVIEHHNTYVKAEPEPAEVGSAN